MLTQGPRTLQSAYGECYQAPVSPFRVMGSPLIQVCPEVLFRSQVPELGTSRSRLVLYLTMAELASNLKIWRRVKISLYSLSFSQTGASPCVHHGVQWYFIQKVMYSARIALVPLRSCSPFWPRVFPEMSSRN